MQAFNKIKLLSSFWLTIFIYSSVIAGQDSSPLSTLATSESKDVVSVQNNSAPLSTEKKDSSPKKERSNKELEFKNMKESMMQDEAKIIGAVTSIKDLVAKSNISNATDMTKQLEIILDVFKSRSEMHKKMSHQGRDENTEKDKEDSGGLSKKGPKRGYGWPRRRKSRKYSSEEEQD